MGQINDRGLYVEYRDKPIRGVGASFFEELGATTFFDDFIGDTLNTDLWLLTKTDGTDAATTGATFAIAAAAGDPSAGHGGWASASPDQSTDTATSVEMGIGADGAPVSGFKATRAGGADGSGVLAFTTALTLPVITNIRVNAGLTDDPTEGAVLAASLATTTWTTTATDMALWVFDTAATTDVFYGQTSSGTTDGTAVASSAPVAATAVVLRIEMDSLGNANFYRGASAAALAYVGTVVNGDATGGLHTSLLTPYIGISNAINATDGISVEVDYVRVSSAR